jgi:hypothetical protein
VAERKAVKAILEKRNLGMGGLPNWVPLDQWPHLPWYRELIGDWTWSGIALDGSAFSADEIRRIKDAYPEVSSLILDGTQKR